MDIAAGPAIEPSAPPEPELGNTAPSFVATGQVGSGHGPGARELAEGARVYRLSDMALESHRQVLEHRADEASRN